MLSNNILWNSEHVLSFDIIFLFVLFFSFFICSSWILPKTCFLISFILFSYLVFFRILNHLIELSTSFESFLYFIFMLLSIHNNNTITKWIFFHPSFQSLLKSYDLGRFLVTKFTLNSKDQRSFQNWWTTAFFLTFNDILSVKLFCQS